MNLNVDLMINSLPLLIVGAGITIQITAISVGLGLIIGMFVGIARICNVKVLRALAAVYIDFLRGTPLLVQIFLIYFALPMVVGQRVDPFIAAITACGINSGAYIAEIFRAGIQAIGRGQYEAAKTLGMTYPQTMRRIVIPQMIRHVLPPISNETINLVKDTSLIYILAMNDLLRVARTIVQREFDMTPFVIAGVFYLVMTFVLTWAFKKLEAHYAKYDQ